MIPRRGAPPRGVAHRLRAGAYALLPAPGGLLLTLSTISEAAWELPGGGIDPGESPLAALHREVREETGWRIAGARRIAAFRLFTHMPEYGIDAEKVCAVYLARPVLRLGAPTEPGHAAHVVPLRDAVRLLGNPGDRAVVAAWLNGSLRVPAPSVRSR